MDRDVTRALQVEKWEDEDNGLEIELDETLRAAADEVLEEFEVGDTHATCCLFPELGEVELFAMHAYLFAAAPSHGLRLEVIYSRRFSPDELLFNLPWKVHAAEDA